MTDDITVELEPMDLSDQPNESDKVLDAIQTLAKERYTFFAMPVEDDTKIYQMLNAENAFLALWSIMNHEELRGLLKYGGANERFENADQALEWVRTEIYNVIDEYGLDLERGTG